MEITSAQKQIVIWLTVIVALAMIGLASLATYSYRHAMPPYPSLEGEPQSVKAQIDNYEALSKVVEKEETLLYDLLVVRIFEPLFKLLIGGMTAFVFLATPIRAFTDYIRSRTLNKKQL